MQQMDTKVILKYRSVTSGLLQALLFLAVFLPGGSAFGLPNVKVLALGLFLAVLVVFALANHEGPSRANVIFLLLVGSCLVLWSLVGVFNGQGRSSEVLYQVKDIGSTILLAWATCFAIRKNIVLPESVIRAVIYGCFALSVAKLAVIAAALSRDLDVVEIVQRTFGEFSFVTGPLVPGLFRMEVSSDILQPFAVFALLATKIGGVKFSRIWTFVILLALLASGFFAFARYIWGAYFVAIVAAIIVQRNWKALALAVVAVLAFYGVFREVSSTVFESRFLSEGTEISDYERAEQTRALIDEFERRPILGKGMGSHASAIVRLETHSYAYEIQWLALLMQFGVVGLAAILLLIWVSMRDLIAAKNFTKIWLCLLYLVWLLASFTNSHLTSSFAGATFALFIAMFHKVRYSNVIEDRYSHA
jgi:hypothetical protein